MKKTALILLLCHAAISVWAVTARVSASPSRPIAGEPFTLLLTVDSAENFDLYFPENINGLSISRQFSGNSMRQSIINGRRSVEVSRSMRAVAEKAGMLTIPAFELKFANETIRTAPLTLEVRDASTLPAGEKLSAKMNILPKRQVYVGEVIQADVELFIPRSMQLSGISDISIKNFSGGIPVAGDGRFGGFADAGGYRTADGMCLELRSVMQVQQIGTFTPECRLDLQVSRNGSSSMFFGPPAEKRSISVKSALSLKVLPLPPPPADVINTGLIGKWQCSAVLGKNELRAGDIAEAVLKFSGSTPSMNFRAPEVNIPGARVYPPEVQKTEDNKSFTVKYPFVPLKPGKYTLNLPLAVFDPEKGEYRTDRLNIDFTVAENPELKIPAADFSSAAPDVPAQAPDLIPFPVVEPSGAAAIPLGRNSLPWIMIAAAAVLAAATVKIFLFCRSSRKNECGKKLQPMLREMNRSDNISDVLEKYGPSDIAECLGMPPGSGFAEIAERADDPEVEEFFRLMGNRGFLPGTEREAEMPQQRAKVIRFLKRLSLFMTAAAALILNSGSYDVGKAAFDAGDYSEAKAEFLKAVSNHSEIDPAILYDLGCAEYMLGNHAEAYLAFTRAALLDPWKLKYSDAAEKAAARLPAVPDDPSVLSQMTALLRPDHCISAAAAAIAIAVVILMWRKKLSSPAAAALLSLMTVIAVIAVLAALYQSANAYSPDNGIVTAKNCLLRSIPAQSGGKQTGIEAGSAVVICEEKGDFYRVSLPGKGGGWIRKSDMQRVFPYGIF